MAPRHKAKILLVDDNPANLVTLGATVDELGLESVTAKSGKEALKCLLAEEFALILLDVQMPDMDGFETARLIRLRDKTRHIPIIFVTAMHRDQSEAHKGYSLGAVDYIIKPYPPEVLKSKISVFVHLYEMREEVRRQSDVIREHERREYESRLAEAARKMEEETYRMREDHRITQMILEHAPIGIVRLDRELIIREVNQVFGEYLKLDPSDMIYRKLFDALPWLPQQPFCDAVEKGDRFFTREFELPADHDESIGSAAVGRQNRFWDLALWPIEGEHDEIIGAVLIAVDVAERVRLARHREDFVATLAHDLQTPVIASDRGLELLINADTGNMDDAQRKLVTMLRENNKSLLNMIQRLLDVYRYEAGAQVHYFDGVRLKLTLETCIGDLAAIAEEHGLTILSELPSNLRKVWADRTAIRRVITNLLENAIKFSPSGGAIRIAARNTPDAVLLEISNSGPGIQPEDIPRLFERFWHKSPTKGYKVSSGLGLYLCKQIVDAHGGEIWCESEPAVSTTFYVKLPVRKGSNIEDTVPPAAVPAAPA